MESKEAVKERMKRYRDRKKLEALKADPGMKAIPVIPAHIEPPKGESFIPCKGGCLYARGIELAVLVLQEQVRRLENPDEVTRRQALKGRPNELYGA